MTQEFVPSEQAFKLKQLGFDEPCFAWYNDNGNYMLGIDEVRFDTKNTYHFNNTDSVSAPLYQQAFRWFREKHNILATIYSNASGYLYEWSDSVGGTHRGWSEYEGPNDGGVWDTYEEAELACLNRLIEIVESNTKEK